MKRFLILAILLLVATSTATAAPLLDEVGDYRYRILSEPEVSATGDVYFDIDIQRCDALDGEDCDDWQQVEQGHFTVTVDGDDIYDCSQAAGTVGEKRDCVYALIEADPRFANMVKSDRAQVALISLMPGGEWPGVVARGITVE